MTGYNCAVAPSPLVNSQTWTFQVRDNGFGGQNDPSVSSVTLRQQFSSGPCRVTLVRNVAEDFCGK
jgi:hypothetical protein